MGAVGSARREFRATPSGKRAPPVHGWQERQKAGAALRESRECSQARRVGKNERGEPGRASEASREEGARLRDGRGERGGTGR